MRDGGGEGGEGWGVGMLQRHGGDNVMTFNMTYCRELKALKKGPRCGRRNRSLSSWQTAR